jgi:hypothetical protein
MDLRVLCLNCQGGYHGALMPFLRDQLRRRRYSFILLQETPRSFATGAALFAEAGYGVALNDRLMIAYDTGVARMRGGATFVAADAAKPLWRFGCLSAAFQHRESRFSLVSIHLPSFLHVIRRAKFLRRIRTSLTGSVLLAGDFNSVLPGEQAFHRSLLSPHVVELRNPDHTYDSSRLERWNTLSRILKAVPGGFYLTASIDKVYASPAFLEDFTVTAASLKEAVSDHLPIEISCIRNAQPSERMPTGSPDAKA